jgi:hypothetical protein
LKEVANDPKATNCTGAWLAPELIVPSWDFLYGYTLGRLFWNPNEVTYPDLIRNFARLRFGSESIPNMEKCIQYLETFNNDIRVKAGVGEGHYLMPFHRVCIIWHPGNPYTDEKFISVAKAKLKEDVTPLREALRYALTEKERPKGDRLYEDFLTELARTYISEIATHHMIMVYQDYKAATRLFKQGKLDPAKKYIDDFEKESRMVDKTLGLLEDLLSTREDYSLRRFSERVMKVPGTKPETARDIKSRFWYINGYYRNEIYEVLRDVYRPEVSAFVGELKRRIQSKETELIDFSKKEEGPFGETLNPDPNLRAAAKVIKDQFLGNPIMPKKERGKSTIEIVQEAFDTLLVPAGLAIIDIP